MPYIIVVNRPGHLPEADPVAVATVEEARDRAADDVRTSMDAFGDDREALQRYGFLDAELAAMDVPEHGGTIGPMSDGYVIDVQFYTWLEMRAKTDVITVGQYPSDSEKELIIDHYNGGTR